MVDAIAQRIARNTAWFTVGSILQKVISFAYFTVVAMAFGVSGTGRYFFALTFSALFTVLADWGIGAVLTREVAKDRARGLALLAPVVCIRAAMIVITIVVITIFARVIGYTAETRVMIGIATAALSLDAAYIAFFALLRGIQRVHYEAIGLVVGQTVLTVSGVAIFILRAGLHIENGALAISEPIHGAWLLLPYVFTSATNLAIAIVGCVRERVLVWDMSAVTRATVRWIFRISTPFALTAGLSRIYTYSDTFLLSVIAGDLAVAYYSTPFKVTFAFQFIPLSFIPALYPAMSALAVRSRDELAALFVAAVRSLLFIALPIAFGIGVLASRIIGEIYGPEFAPSVSVLAILIASLPFVFVNFPAGYLLNACDRQTTNTKLVALATVVNIAGNLALIPVLGVRGAAIAAVLATIVLTIANMITVRRVVRYRLHTVLDTFLRVLVACLAMAAMIGLTRSLPLGIVVLLGALTYVGVAFVVRAVRWSEVRGIIGYFRRTRAGHGNGEIV